MNNPESVKENEMHEIYWDFETQTDQLTPARISDLMIVKRKKTLLKPRRIREGK